MKTVLLTSLLSVAPFLSALAHDMVLTNVPMQGPMVHVGFTYHAEHRELHVHAGPNVPQLTPLHLSEPEAMFQAGDPWHELLDPHRGGQAFNRQYGFVMDAGSDPLPAGATIWIRQLSATPGLQAFRYRGTEPRQWEPMFGTGGSTNLFAWNLTMFHPAYACPADGGPHAAEYEAFLVEPSTGEPLAGETPVRFTLTWTVAGQGAAKLEISQRVLLAWPLTGTPQVVESSDRLEGGVWTAITNPPFQLDGKFSVLLPPEAGARFYRLRPQD